MRKPLSEEFRISSHSLAAHIFEPYAYQFVQRRSFDESNQLAAQSFGQKGRDWVNFGTVLAAITSNPQWKNHMAVAHLYQNSRVGRFHGSELTVFVNSPAWATQLGFMKEQMITKINEQIEGLEISDIRFIGPQPEPYKRKRYPRY